MLRTGIAVLLLVFSVAAGAAEIVLPASDFERDQAVVALYRTSSLASGKGTLTIRWTDVLGRVVEDRTIPVELTDENEIPFPLNLQRAVAMQNTLAAQFTFDGVNRKGEHDHRDERAQTNFIARPPDRDWRDYRIVMWQPYAVDMWKALQCWASMPGSTWAATSRLRTSCSVMISNGTPRTLQPTSTPHTTATFRTAR